MAETARTNTAEKRYKDLSPAREAYIIRADRCARLSLPMYESIYERLGRGAQDRIKQPWQTLGGLGTNNLAAKLLLTMLPPNAPIFRHKVKAAVLADAEAEGGADIKSEIDKALGKMERETTDKIESCGDRATVFEGLKRIIITGNALLKLEEEASRVYPLTRFVVVRDPQGAVLEIVIEEEKGRETLPDDVKAFLDEQQAKPSVNTKKADKKTVKIFTWVKLKGNLIHEHQEIDGVEVPGTRGSYPPEKSPWIPLRFYRIEGEDYGRSYVEEVLGDLISLENLYKAAVETSAAVARILFFVNPNGVTKQAEVANAKNGDVLVGNAADVTVLTAEKRADLQVTMSMIERVEARLQKAFLMNTAIQRKGERVTAEEIRYMATELDDALGGVYTMQAREFQLPFVQARQHMMTLKGELPSLPKGMVYPAILTGYDALGRNFDKQKLVAFLQTIAGVLGQEAFLLYVNASEGIKRLATADGIDPEGLIRTETEVQAAQQQNQMAAMAQNLGPEALKQIGNVATKGM